MERRGKGESGGGGKGVGKGIGKEVAGKDRGSEFRSFLWTACGATPPVFKVLPVVRAVGQRLTTAAPERVPRAGTRLSPARTRSAELT
ncbi:hypothetical protein GCM10010324_37410 [Streptomyces hiroshimensis]|uniref:Uncharacterized protein n=1 Tax=Streptomyces hiroshimensis TaxID=66424 RepID=A0ABQ2YM02_9ACTN|nr:hypothetical protein GCM10010324_37410 [Streptomyces hiroshimensis]